MTETSGRELDGKVAIITGAARNIGRATAVMLASGGARVVVNTKTSVDEANETRAAAEAAGGEAMVIQADIAKPEEVQRMVDETVKAWGTVDCLIHNAAVRRHSPLPDISYEEWRSIIAIILDGAFLCTKAVVPHMKAQGSGAIVLLGGLTAHCGAEERAHVTAGKAGLVGFAKGLAHELGPHGITINVVAPGLIDTTRGTASAPVRHHEHLAPVVNRVGKPEDIAAMIRHLCGPHGRYVTGQTYHVNGGAYMQ
ncbi:MAG TPA: SDR family oxidoreductase [Alphaproteobacteria bacterium]|jgi:3-oxoacyl-[acyl-carrier protein] reductase